MNRLSAWLFEWLSPNGVIAAGVLAGLVQQFFAKRAAVQAAGRAEQAAVMAAEHAATASAEVQSVAANVLKIEVATNSMKDALIESTATSSKLQGREEMRAEQAAEKARE